MVSYHSVSAASVLARVPYLFPVVGKIEAETPATKIDKRKFNKGEVYRNSWSFVCKARAIDEYLQRKDVKFCAGRVCPIGRYKPRSNFLMA
jgi:hypothetical protein